MHGDPAHRRAEQALRSSVLQQVSGCRRGDALLDPAAPVAVADLEGVGCLLAAASKAADREIGILPMDARSRWLRREAKRDRHGAAEARASTSGYGPRRQLCPSPGWRRASTDGLRRPVRVVVRTAAGRALPQGFGARLTDCRNAEHFKDLSEHSASSWGRSLVRLDGASDPRDATALALWELPADPRLRSRWWVPEVPPLQPG